MAVFPRFGAHSQLYWARAVCRSLPEGAVLLVCLVPGLARVVCRSLRALTFAVGFLVAGVRSAYLERPASPLRMYKRDCGSLSHSTYVVGWSQKVTTAWSH
eukprot:COSAG01_NODE_6017_length_3899_cov_21.556842_1_plen_101_part_00